MTSLKQRDISIQTLFAFALIACSDPSVPEHDVPVVQQAIPSADARRPVFLTSGLDLAPWDSTLLRDPCLAEAPWGEDSWGVEAATFQTSEAASDGIRGARVSVEDGIGQLVAQENEGRWGLVRLIQGDVWGGTNCGPVPWARPTPLTLDAPLFMELDVRVDSMELTSWLSSWVLIGVNVWISSPSFPAGDDIEGRKPLVLDLMVFHETNMFAIHDGSHEDEAAFHFQHSVAAVPLRRWQHVRFDLSAHITAALSHFSLDAAVAVGDARIHQVEVVVEVHNAEALARVKNLEMFALAE